VSVTSAGLRVAKFPSEALWRVHAFRSFLARISTQYPLKEFNIASFIVSALSHA
jgi:hypothetical protein